MKRRSRRRRRSANVDSPPDTTGASRLNGTYTFTATVKAFNDVGIPDQAFIDLNAGHYTVTMKDGSLQRTQRYTSGPRAGEPIGSIGQSPIYHASLDPDEYRSLLDDAGFDVLGYWPEEPECSGHTIWLARRR